MMLEHAYAHSGMMKGVCPLTTVCHPATCSSEFICLLVYFSQLHCVYLAIAAHETQQKRLENGIANPQIALRKLQHSSHIAEARHFVCHALMSVQLWLNLSIVK